MRMKFLKFDSVLPGYKTQVRDGFSGRAKLLSSRIINEFLKLLTFLNVSASCLLPFSSVN